MQKLRLGCHPSSKSHGLAVSVLPVMIPRQGSHCSREPLSLHSQHLMGRCAKFLLHFSGAGNSLNCVFLMSLRHE